MFEMYLVSKCLPCPCSDVECSFHGNLCSHSHIVYRYHHVFINHLYHPPCCQWFIRYIYYWNIQFPNNNRLLYSVKYNMERYCMSLYCIENPYWTRRRRHQVQYGFSIQYGRVQYISILYITLYNDLFIIQLKWSIL